jgi:tetratricopeptide (TPR) repeat protein
VWKAFKDPWICIAVITAVTTLVYLNSLRVPFIFDDIYGIVNNPAIHLEDLSLTELKEAMRNNRPVSSISLALNYYFGGFNVVGYHMVNLLIHCLTAALVYIFFLKIFPPSASAYAFWGSLLWSVHPVHTQAVTYMIQRMTGLATLFFMLSLVLYIQGSANSGRKRILFFLFAGTAGLLGMGSKEIAVTLPLIILLYELYFRARFDPSSLKRLWKDWLPFVAVTLVFIAVYLIRQGGLIVGLQALLTKDFTSETLTSMERLLTESRVILFYLSLLVLPLPSRLNLDHDFTLSTSLLNPPTTFLCVLSIFLFIFYAVRIAKKYPVVSFGMLWFFMNLALESTFIKLDLIFEHRIYLPSIGIFLAGTWIFMRITHQFQSSHSFQADSGGFFNIFLLKRTVLVKAGLILLSVSLLGFYLVSTFLRNEVWQDNIGLLRDAVKKSPQNARVHNNLGILYLRKGDLDLARQEFEEALRLNPKYLLYRNNLAGIYERKGKFQEAIGLYQEALQIDPLNALVYERMGRLYSKSDHQDLAIMALEKAISLDPDRDMTFFYLGQAYQKSGHNEKAALAYQQALRLAKNEEFKPMINHPLKETKKTLSKPTLHYQLGQIYEEMEKPTLAIQEYQEAIRTLPGFLPARQRLFSLYMKTGRPDLAANEYQEMAEEEPRLIDTQDKPDMMISP